MGRWLVVVLSAAAGFMLVWVVVDAFAHRAELRPTQELPDDVRVELESVWASFERVFPDRLDTIADVEVELVADVAGGDARYLIEEQRIEIAIPTSPRRFRESVAHELAHHVEHTDPGFGSLRREIATLLGVGVEEWFIGDRWETTPSEIWAEAVVEAVTSDRVRHGRNMPVSPELVDAVMAWGRGKSTDT